jgi:hypothetical protein
LVETFEIPRRGNENVEFLPYKPLKIMVISDLEIATLANAVSMGATVRPPAPIFHLNRLTRFRIPVIAAKPGCARSPELKCATVADPGIFQRGGSTLKVGFQREGSTIIWGFQRGVPLSKCVISTLFLQNFLTKGGVSGSANVLGNAHL